MAIIKPGPIADAISGSLGSVTFARAQGRSLVRMRPSKSTPSSAAALQARARHVAALRAWADLSDLQRAGWTACAPSYTLHDRLGHPYIPSPRALFIWFNSWLSTRRGFTYSTPPYLGRYPSPSIVSVSFQAGGPYSLTLSMSPAFSVGGYHCDASTALSTTRVASRSPSLISHGVFVNGVAQNLYSDWCALLPELSAGVRFSLRVWGWTMNYAPSYPVWYHGTCA